MSLSFQQIYAKNVTSNEFFNELNMQCNNHFSAKEFFDKEKLISITNEDRIKIFSNNNDPVIYKQYNVCVLQTSNRNNKFEIDPNIQELSEKLDTMVIWLDHYESYVTGMKVFEKGKLILNMLELDDGFETFETDDARFIELKKRIEELSNAEDSFEKLKQEDLTYVRDPSPLFTALGLDFYKLYNPNKDDLEEVLFFS